MSADKAVLTVVLDGRTLQPAQVDRIAGNDVRVELDPDGLARVAAAHRAMAAASTRRPVYGRTTGVGANRTQPAAGGQHDLQLARSHATGVGDVLAGPATRAMMAIRANQLLAGGSGVHPDAVAAIAAALTGGFTPVVHRMGGLGTGDLTALAEMVLALLGEGSWHDGDHRAGAAAPHLTLHDGDALGLMSSNALTLGVSARASVRIDALLRSTLVVSALSFCALRGNAEAYAEAVQRARPHAAQTAVAARLRRLLDGWSAGPRFIQDPYGLRLIPSVHGSAVNAAGQLAGVLRVELNSAAENPLVAGTAVYHHGNFDITMLGLALDGLRLAVLQTATLSAARLATLMDPEFTDLPAFLAAGPAGSSGAMLLEYAANAALAEVRQAGYASALGHAVLSRGVEWGAGFAATGAFATDDMAGHYRLVIACEAVAAVRALRQGEVVLPAGSAVEQAFQRLGAQLDPDPEDRSLSVDVAAAADALPDLAQLVAPIEPTPG